MPLIPSNMTIPVYSVDWTAERRRYRRVRVNLAGRYLLANHIEYACKIRDISPRGLALMAPVSGRLGERIVAYVDRIGRLEGPIVRTLPTGFAMMIAATEHGRDRIAARINLVAANQEIL